MEMTNGNLLDIRTDHNCVTDLGLLFYLLYGYYREWLVVFHTEILCMYYRAGNF